MKKIIHFSKAFIPTVILSAAIIISGLVVFCTKGINYGIDFEPGLIEQVRIAPSVFSLEYNGFATASVESNASDISIIISGAGADNKTVVFNFAEYPTAKDMIAGMKTLDGVIVTLLGNDTVSSESLFTDSSLSTVLSNVPYSFHSSEQATNITASDVRTALAPIDEISVKQVGEDALNTFQVRISDNGDGETSAQMQEHIASILDSSFGAENVAVISTDYVGSQFSKQLATRAVLLLVGTLFLIWIYATVRFKWDFALGAVLAILHDALIMFAFISWTQMEFTTTILAAVLTVIGYSINDTVVVLDRVRDNIRTVKVKKFYEILDISQTEILSRTIITTVTTLLAVIALLVFTTGSMRDFATALLIGMISGVYSTIFIAGAFIALVRRGWKQSDEKVATVAEAKNVAVFTEE